MPKRINLPVALTIAGSDSGGGAGIQADLKTFAALGVHGTSAIACLTAQNPNRVLAVESCSPKMLRRQIEAVFEELPPRAVKTGMLFSAENIQIVARFFQNQLSAIGHRPLVVDPVMVSTSGARLLLLAAENNIPVFTAAGWSSPNTACICRSSILGEAGSIPRTCRGFWAVRQAMALAPWTPSAANVFKSAWMPAPPPLSEPAMVSATGIFVLFIIFAIIIVIPKYEADYDWD